MCGITAVYCHGDTYEIATRRLGAMASAQQHRGPDNTGAFVEAAHHGHIGLGQQRLSILDLSPAAHQPLASPCGRYILSYNGEVYNYKEIRRELASDHVASISDSDTSVVLAALMQWGSDAFSRFNGMWAIILYDRIENRLLVSRDRMGVKPLYFARDDRSFIAASEIKGVLAGGLGRQYKLNNDVIARFFLQSLVAGQNETFFRGIEAFPAGSYAWIDLGKISVELRPERFWTHPLEVKQPIALNEFPFDETVHQIRDVFFDSVRLRLRSDVPVGVMLSGGLDSSAILAAAKAAGNQSRLRAFSVVSDDPATSEEPYIDRMITHTGLPGTKVKSDANAERYWDELDATVWHFDYPINDFSNIAARDLMGSARDKGLVVLLTGQGSDEQLAGYSKFLYFYLIDRLRNGRVGDFASMLCGCINNRTILHEFSVANAKRYIPWLRGHAAGAWMGPKLKKATLLSTGLENGFNSRLLADIKNFSLPDLLLAEDRGSMSHSAEMRTPFLDFRLVELLATVPAELKLHRGWTKYIFRRAINKDLPQEITWRKDKKGYSLPGAIWMAGPLSGRIKRQFDQPLEAVKRGYISHIGAKELLAKFLTGSKLVRASDIIAIIAFESWLKQFGPYIAD